MVRVFLVALILGAPHSAAQAPFYVSQLIFPVQQIHNHASCIVLCPNGDKLVAWYRGAGEKEADNVRILGARQINGSVAWSRPFLLADTLGFPDANPVLFIDPQERLWLMWPTVLDNTWESTLMKYRISSDYMDPARPPVWDSGEVLHIKQLDNFEQIIHEKTEEYLGPQPWSPGETAWAEANFAQAANKLTSRLGWFGRAHPTMLPNGRLLLGLYSDGFLCSLVAITDNLGETWTFSEPIVGHGALQPSFAVKRNGEIVTYMRDNVPRPRAVHVSSSVDRGETWSTVQDHPFLTNPGSALELANLRNGDWILVYNDVFAGRHSLAVSISEDDGETWAHTRHLELRMPGDGDFSYPSVTQDNEGMIHVTYSVVLNRPLPGEVAGKTIKYVRFNKAWVVEGDS
jgi:predicted neuraminidase